MKIVSNIHYTDAYYISEPVELPVTKLPHNEAFGFIKKGAATSTSLSELSEDERKIELQKQIIQLLTQIISLLKLKISLGLM
ncbi:MAG: hypothetical protein WDZ75_01595 [Candidatus Paceibacterota bacterium]